VTEIMSMASVSVYPHLHWRKPRRDTMTIIGIYRAIVEWAARPVLTHDNENELWRMSAHELADLPFGPEPTDEPSAFEPERRNRCA